MTLRVEISIIPFGDEKKKRVLETFNISNSGLSNKEGFEYFIEHNEYKTGKKNLPSLRHKREEGAIALASKALLKECKNERI